MEVFFFTATVNVTDQFWPISRRVTDWFSTKDTVEKVENPFKEVWL